MTGHRLTALKRTASLLVAAVFLLQTGVSRTFAHQDSSDLNSSGVVGRRMFFGETPLLGAIVGHPEPLPSQMVACTNCHLADTGTGSGASFAPQLNRSMLTELRRRRGGPPSVFSPANFCRMLRTGVDPAYIVITRQMPRYTLRDDQCLGLWRYLTESPNARGQE